MNKLSQKDLLIVSVLRQFVCRFGEPSYSYAVSGISRK